MPSEMFAIDCAIGVSAAGGAARAARFCRSCCGSSAVDSTPSGGLEGAPFAKAAAGTAESAEDVMPDIRHPGFGQAFMQCCIQYKQQASRLCSAEMEAADNSPGAPFCMNCVISACCMSS